MIHYLLLAADGAIRQRGHCHTEDDLPQVPGMTIEVIDAEDPREPLKVVRNGYQDQRRMAYPNIGDQLDAIWELLAKSPLLAADPAAKAVYDRVKAVKLRFPKS